jgi:hypothetical protein
MVAFEVITLDGIFKYVKEADNFLKSEGIEFTHTIYVGENGFMIVKIEV